MFRNFIQNVQKINVYVPNEYILDSEGAKWVEIKLQNINYFSIFVALVLPFYGLIYIHLWYDDKLCGDVLDHI
jgi:hypothetical protein